MNGGYWKSAIEVRWKQKWFLLCFTCHNNNKLWVVCSNKKCTDNSKNTVLSCNSTQENSNIVWKPQAMWHDMDHISHCHVPLIMKCIVAIASSRPCPSSKSKWTVWLEPSFTLTKLVTSSWALVDCLADCGCYIINSLSNVTQNEGFNVPYVCVCLMILTIWNA